LKTNGLSIYAYNGSICKMMEMEAFGSGKKKMDGFGQIERVGPSFGRTIRETGYTLYPLIRAIFSTITQKVA
jgi:hypothetical protein